MIDEIYKEVFEIANRNNFTVPIIFRPYNSTKHNIEKWWGASVEGNGIEISAYGITPEEALNKLKDKILNKMCNICNGRGYIGDNEECPICHPNKA